MSSTAQAARMAASGLPDTAWLAANTNKGRMRLPPSSTAYRMGSAKLGGVLPAGATQAPKAASTAANCSVIQESRSKPAAEGSHAWTAFA